MKTHKESNISKVYAIAVNETFTIQEYIFLKRPVYKRLQEILFIKEEQEPRSFGYCLSGKDGKDAHILNTKHIQELIEHGVFAKDDLDELETVQMYLENNFGAAFDDFVNYCDKQDFGDSIPEDTFKDYAIEAFISGKNSITELFFRDYYEKFKDNKYVTECLLSFIADSEVNDYQYFLDACSPYFSPYFEGEAQATANALRWIKSYNQQPALCLRRDIFKEAERLNSKRLIVFADTSNGPVVCIPKDMHLSFIFALNAQEQNYDVWRGCSYFNKAGELCDVLLDEITEIRTEHNEIVFQHKKEQE